MNKSQKNFEAAAILNQIVTDLEHASKVLPVTQQFEAGQLRLLIDAVKRLRLDLNTRGQAIKDKKE